MYQRSAYDEARGGTEMSETGSAEKDTREIGPLVVYAIFLVFWVLACTLFGIFLFTTPWLVVPFVAGAAWIVYDGVETYCKPVKYKTEKAERDLFAWIVRYTGNIMVAITIVLLVAVYTGGRIQVPNSDLLACFIYGFSALGVAALCILPFPWLSDVGRTRVLRHIKTAAHLFVVFLFFCSVVALAVGIYRALALG